MKRSLIDISIAHRRVLLWIIAAVITLASAVYQRRTGPSYPIDREQQVFGTQVSYNFLRSYVVGEDASVAVTVADTSIHGILRYRRYRSNDEWTELYMTRGENGLEARLPMQPAAGKIMYFVDLEKNDLRISLTEVTPIILRYRGSVPVWVLLPHVLLMFVAMLFANRAGLESLDSKGNSYRLLLWTIALFFVGGFILGPLMQKYAFDAYWTGFPFGKDLTDSKTLFAMLGWIVAWWRNRGQRDGRMWILFAAILMLAIYLIPHSLLGSELDYTAISE